MASSEASSARAAAALEWYRGYRQQVARRCNDQELAIDFVDVSGMLGKCRDYSRVQD